MAAANYFDSVQKLYIAFYQRPADSGGLLYWSQRLDAAKGSLEGVVDAFATSAEANALHGAVDKDTVGAVVDKIYQALFNRTPDEAGKKYYVDGFLAGKFTAGTIVLDVLNGASNDDLVAINNKVTVANRFTETVDGRAMTDGDFGVGTVFAATYAGDTDVQAAREILAGVTSNPATMLTAGDVAAQVQSKIADQGDAVAGQTSGKTFTLTAGIDNIIGTGGNDAIDANVTPTSAVLGGLDKVDGGAGTDTLNIADTVTAANASFVLPAGFSISNVEAVNVTTNGNIGAAGAGKSFDLSGNAAVTSIKGVAAGTVGSFITASATANVDLTVAGVATATVTGGKAVSVTGGTGATTITGKGLTSVTVKNGGAVTIENLENTVAAAPAAKGTTLTSVTLDSVNANSTVKGEGLTDITIKGATVLANTVAVTNAKADHALTLNVDGTGYQVDGTTEVQTVVTDTVAKTITVNATGSKSSLNVSGSTTATAVNVTGSAALKLNADVANVKSIDGSAATGNLNLGNINAATTTVKTGAGNDQFTLNGAKKVTVDTGAGNDTITLAATIAAGSTINLGAGNDIVLDGAAGVVDPSTATLTSVVDAGEGNDTVAASLINAANAALFKNFESLDLSNTTATALDIELMTGSTITGLTFAGGVGGATVNNVAAGVGLTVTGSDTTPAATPTTIGVKGAAAGTADSFAITFAGTTEAAPTGIDVGTVVVDNVEALTVASSGTGFVANTLTLTDSKLKTLTITGDKALKVDFAGVNGTNGATGGAVSLIDGSAATGKLNINTTNVTADSAAAGLTVKGGSAADTITLAQKATVDAGAGNDTITTAATGGTLTGGAGNDKFDVALAVATGATEAAAVLTTITDFVAGDSVQLLADNVLAGATLGAKTALDATVTNIDLALAIASLTNTANEVSWFQYGTNTYVVANDATAGFAAGDLVVKLTGLVDLTNATLDGATDYLTLA